MRSLRLVFHLNVCISHTLMMKGEPRVTKPTIHPQTAIDHVHLNVSDLDRAERFYTQILGFEVTARFGDEVVVGKRVSSSHCDQYVGRQGRETSSAGDNGTVPLRHLAAEPSGIGKSGQARD